MEYLKKIKLWDEHYCEQHVINLSNNISKIINDNQIEKINLIDIGANVGKVYDLLNKKINIEKVFMFEASPMLFDYLKIKYAVDDKVNLYHGAVNNNEDEVDFDESSMIYQIKNEIEQLNFGLSQIKQTEYSKKIKSVMISKFLEINNFLYDEFCFIKIDTETVDFNILKDLLTVIKNFKITPMIEFEINYKTIGITDDYAQEILNYYNDFGYQKINLKYCFGDGVLIPKKLNV